MMVLVRVESRLAVAGRASAVAALSALDLSFPSLLCLSVFANYRKIDHTRQTSARYTVRTCTCTSTSQSLTDGHPRLFGGRSVHAYTPRRARPTDRGGARAPTRPDHSHPTVDCSPARARWHGHDARPSAAPPAPGGIAHCARTHGRRSARSRIALISSHTHTRPGLPSAPAAADRLQPPAPRLRLQTTAHAAAARLARGSGSRVVQAGALGGERGALRHLDRVARRVVPLGLEA